MPQFTPQELQLIIEIANIVEVKGLQGMQSVLALAGKCQELLQVKPDTDPALPAAD